MRILAVLIFLTVGMAWGQEKAGPSPPAQDDPLNLTRTEVLEGMVIGLEQGQWIKMRECTCLSMKIEELNKLDQTIQSYVKRANEKAIEILKQRGLDPAKYVVNWKESKIEEKGATK